MNDRQSKELPPKRNLRPAEVAAFLDCNVATVYQLIISGKIPAKKFTRHYLIPRDEFLAAWEKASVEPEF